MKKFLLGILALVVILGVVYLSGPTFPKPALTNQLPPVHIQTSELETYIQIKESGLKIKPDNESRIIWANDSLKNKTSYCLLYLHGFSASWYEGNPVHIDFAHRYGMNLYIPLLASHGIDTPDALIDMTPDRLYESAKETLVVAQSLVEKVIVMGTSTGGTLMLKLASEFPGLMEGLILLSPNVAINNPAAFLLSKPWGLQIARMVSKGNYRVTNPDFTSEACKYWNCKYRIEAVVYLQQLVEATMTKETFSKVQMPVFLGYYYKDEANQDKTVRVDAMLKMFDQLGTPENLKQKVAFPEAGDHVIGGKIYSKAWQDVEKASYQFAEEKLGLRPLLRTD
ncbi:MAG: alpha/beta hydrolase [Bacteroidota bacterium]|nr:alpha/beta hydrolase [Bacteroidota bacterium]